MEGKLRYAVLIEWSSEDEAYIVRLPDWERAGIVFGAVTHGDTYEEAAANAHEALDSLVGSLEQHGEPLPEPRTFAAA